MVRGRGRATFFSTPPRRDGNQHIVSERCLYERADITDGISRQYFLITEHAVRYECEAGDKECTHAHGSITAQRGSAAGLL